MHQVNMQIGHFSDNVWNRTHCHDKQKQASEWFYKVRKLLVTIGAKHRSSATYVAGNRKRFNWTFVKKVNERFAMISVRTKWRKRWKTCCADANVEIASECMSRTEKYNDKFLTWRSPQTLHSKTFLNTNTNCNCNRLFPNDIHSLAISHSQSVSDKRCHLNKLQPTNHDHIGHRLWALQVTQWSVYAVNVWWSFSGYCMVVSVQWVACVQWVSTAWVVVWSVCAGQYLATVVSEL